MDNVEKWQHEHVRNLRMGLFILTILKTKQLLLLCLCFRLALLYENAPVMSLFIVY